jgi:hypothetical protein
MSTRNLPGGKGRPVRKADNLTAICEPINWRKCGSLNLKEKKYIREEETQTAK